MDYTWNKHTAVDLLCTFTDTYTIFLFVQIQKLFYMYRKLFIFNVNLACRDGITQPNQLINNYCEFNMLFCLYN